MSISDQFELFVLYFEDKFSKYKLNNQNGFKEQWFGLKSKIKQCILDKMEQEYNNKNCTYSDKYLYQSHIFNNTNNKMDKYIRGQFQNANSISDNGKKIIEQYLNILDDNYIIDKKYYSVVRLYLYKLMILTFENWKNPNSSKYYQHTKEIEKFLDVQYNGQSFLEYQSKILYCKKINGKDDIIYDVIKYFETIINDINKKETIKERLDLMKQKLDKNNNNNNNKFDIDKNVITSLQIKKNIQKKHSKTIKKTRRKKKIPATVRNTVWIKYNGKVFEGICFCCKTESITKSNFECGHIISESDGGEVTIQNLRPICSLCNKSMGKKNMEEFMKKHGYENKLIKKCKHCDRFKNSKFETCCGICRRLHNGTHTDQCNARQIEFTSQLPSVIKNNNRNIKPVKSKNITPKKIKFNINTCSHMELKSIKGIGDKKAVILIENRPYRSFAQIEKLSCIYGSIINEIKKCTRLR